MKRASGGAAAVLVVAAVASCAPAPVPVAPLASDPAAASSVRGLTPDAPFRASAPEPEPRKAWTPPKLHVSTLANGMRVIVVERHVPPLVSVQLVVRGGLAAYPGEPPAAVSLALSASAHGTATRSEVDVFETMNALFAEISMFAEDDWVGARLRAPSSSFDKGLELLRDLVVQPSLMASSVELERQRRLASLPKDSEDPVRVATRLLYGAAYGRTHPYAVSRQPAGDVLAKLGRDDVVKAWRQAVDPADATLIVTGDVDATALAMRVEALFGAWAHDPSRRPPASLPPPSPSAARIVLVDRPGALQATVVFGATVAPTGSPQHVADVVLSEILGGMPSSQVTRLLRDRLGATALGSGQLAWKRGASLAYWQGHVDREKVTDVLRALDGRLRDLREHGPSPSELADAKARFAGSVPRSFETTAGMVEMLAQIPTFGLPVDEFDTRIARIDALTAADVHAAVPSPEATRVVVVGDLASLLGPLRSLGWGPIEERDSGGALVRTIAP
jgi:zinc protease